MNGRTELQVLESGIMNGERNCNEIILRHVRLFRAAVGKDFVFMDDNATPHRARLVGDYVEEVDTGRMVWPTKLPDLSPIEHVRDALGRAIARHQHLPRTV